jgi:hypothetical protein
MKKLLYTLLLAGIAGAAMAQKSNLPVNKYFGINFGYGVAGVMFQPDLKQTSYSGSYSGGLSFKYVGEKYMAFQAELNYTHRGYKMTVDNSNIPSRTYNSVILPIMAQGNVTYKSISVLVNLGCYASYMLNSEYQTNATNGTINSYDYEFFLKRDRRYEFGVLGGVGLGLKLNPILLQVESRYYYGLTNIYNPDYTNNRPYGSRQFQLQFSAALFYDLGSLFGSEPKLTKN